MDKYGWPVITCRAPDDLRSALKMSADKAKRSVSEQIRFILEKYLHEESSQ